MASITPRRPQCYEGFIYRRQSVASGANTAPLHRPVPTLGGSGIVHGSPSIHRPNMPLTQDLLGQLSEDVEMRSAGIGTEYAPSVQMEDAPPHIGEDKHSTNDPPPEIDTWHQQPMPRFHEDEQYRTFSEIAIPPHSIDLILEVVYADVPEKLQGLNSRWFGVNKQLLRSHSPLFERVLFLNNALAASGFKHILKPRLGVVQLRGVLEPWPIISIFCPFGPVIDEKGNDQRVCVIYEVLRCIHDDKYCLDPHAVNGIQTKVEIDVRHMGLLASFINLFGCETRLRPFMRRWTAKNRLKIWESTRVGSSVYVKPLLVLSYVFHDHHTFRFMSRKYIYFGIQIYTNLDKALEYHYPANDEILVLGPPFMEKVRKAQEDYTRMLKDRVAEMDDRLCNTVCNIGDGDLCIETAIGSLHRSYKQKRNTAASQTSWRFTPRSASELPGEPLFRSVGRVHEAVTTALSKRRTHIGHNILSQGHNDCRVKLALETMRESIKRLPAGEIFGLPLEDFVPIGATNEGICIFNPRNKPRDEIEKLNLNATKRRNAGRPAGA
ncbi:hypothetical protein BDZ91DRAFT_752359, partial [Kalaharituber pfeilii]